jgi:hypothetical protein
VGILRFYIEGDEIDVADPKFFIEEDEIIEMKEAIEDMLENYVSLSLVK